MIFNFWKQVEFLQATKTIIFRNTNISNHDIQFLETG